jgi:hypothetical protein
MKSASKMTERKEHPARARSKSITEYMASDEESPVSVKDLLKVLSGIAMDIAETVHQSIETNNQVLTKMSNTLDRIEMRLDENRASPKLVDSDNYITLAMPVARHALATPELLQTVQQPVLDDNVQCEHSVSQPWRSQCAQAQLGQAVQANHYSTLTQ